MLHGVTYQKNIIFFIVFVMTANLTESNSEFTLWGKVRHAVWDKESPFNNSLAPLLCWYAWNDSAQLQTWQTSHGTEAGCPAGSWLVNPWGKLGITATKWRASFPMRGLSLYGAPQGSLPFTFLMHWSPGHAGDHRKQGEEMSTWLTCARKGHKF